MTEGKLVVRQGVPVWELSSGEPQLRSAQDALDVIGEAAGAQVDWVSVPAATLGDTFFRLSSGLAGEIAQKFVNYHVGLAIIGDISAHVDASAPLRAFVYETNRGPHLWFLESEAAFDERLTRS